MICISHAIAGYPIWIPCKYSRKVLKSAQLIRPAIINQIHAWKCWPNKKTIHWINQRRQRIQTKYLCCICDDSWIKYNYRDACFIHECKYSLNLYKSPSHTGCEITNAHSAGQKNMIGFITTNSSALAVWLNNLTLFSDITDCFFSLAFFGFCSFVHISYQRNW